jgi:hypothetical protein
LLLCVLPHPLKHNAEVVVVVFLVSTHKTRKVLFLCAIARPKYDVNPNKILDSKIGIWPIGYMGVAQGNSRNCPGGTLVWVNTLVTPVVHRELLIQKIIPAIAQKWPGGT